MSDLKEYAELVAMQSERIVRLESLLVTARRRIKGLRRARKEDQRHINKLHRIVGDWRKWFQL